MKKVLFLLLITIGLLYTETVFAVDEEDVLPPVDSSNYDVYEGEITLAGDDFPEKEDKSSIGTIIFCVGLGIAVISSGVVFYKKVKKNQEI